MFGQIVESVVWSDHLGVDGRQVVPADPAVIVDSINSTGLPLLLGHDPGLPVGIVLSAAIFTSSAGNKFVAAVLGLYKGGKRLSFHELGVDVAPSVSSPSSLPVASDHWHIIFATDPREFEAAWVDEAVRNTPLRIKRKKLSHNAADSLIELIRLGLPYALLVWNPFVTTIANEAAKEVYAGTHRWLRSLFDKFSERRNPVLAIQSWRGDCQISFMFRGTDVKHLYTALEGLPNAARQAELLVAGLNARNLSPREIVYEFQKEGAVWFPSFAQLNDGQLITDNMALIAIENLPSGLSLGLGLDTDISGH